MIRRILLGFSTTLMSACSLLSTPTPVPPTATIPPTAAPTATRAAAATPTATTVATVTRAPDVSTTCNHPYFPIKANAKWQYRTQVTGIAPSTYTVTFLNITANAFTEHREFSTGLTTDVRWNCSAEGLASTQFANLTTPSSQFKFEYVKSNGVMIPPANRWVAGTSWNFSYEVKGQMISRGAPVNAQGTIEIGNRIVGPESVTVPAGKYNAVKVDQTFKMKLNVTVSGVAVPTEISFNGNSWFVQNVGMVKSTSTDPVVSTVELISFTP